MAELEKVQWLVLKLSAFAGGSVVHVEFQVLLQIHGSKY